MAYPPDPLVGQDGEREADVKAALVLGEACCHVNDPDWAREYWNHALDSLNALVVERDAAERALEFYAAPENWTQMTSWGSRIHDENSAAIRDGGRKARAFRASKSGLPKGTHGAS